MRDETIRIEGIRIVLRDATLDDLGPLAHWLQPGHRWHELDGPMYDQPPPGEVARILDDRRALLASAERPRPRTNLSIAAIDSEIMLGQVTWSGIVSATGLNIVIYNPDLWGYGLGYEAFGLWCDYLFEEAPALNHLHLETWSGNAGMVRLAKKLGFVEQSRDRRSTVVGGRRFDSLRYALDRGEWQRQFPDGFVASLEGEQ